MKSLVVANWKMYPNSVKEAEQLLGLVEKGVKVKNSDLEIVICPPFIWLEYLMSKFKSKKGLVYGAQNCHWELSGAFTGEVSAAMLADLGVKYVILGHSERRQYLGETDTIINSKIKTALKTKIKPILCVGEREGEEMNLVVEDQLIKDLADLNFNQVKELIVAYEPVWAIGTGRPCLPDNALSAGLFIHRILTQLYSRFLAEKVPVLYGGSVDAKNAANYVKQANMNGLLVGGSSLNAESFVKIINNVYEKHSR